jgi:hypothetical protein
MDRCTARAGQKALRILLSDTTSGEMYIPCIISEI